MTYERLASSVLLWSERKRTEEKFFFLGAGFDSYASGPMRIRAGEWKRVAGHGSARDPTESTEHSRGHGFGAGQCAREVRCDECAKDDSKAQASGHDCGGALCVGEVGESHVSGSNV